MYLENVVKKRLTFRTQSSNSTTILILESQLFIKFTSALWSAFSMSTPFIDNITSPKIHVVKLKFIRNNL